MPSSGADSTGGVVAGAQTLLRALDILDCFDTTGAGLTLSDITRSVGLTAPTTHRLLKALVSRNMLVYDGDRFYNLGPSIMRLANAVMHRTADLVRICTPTLVRLRERTGESAALFCLVGHERLCIAELVSLQPIRMESGIGHVYPLHIGASGKVLLAWNAHLMADLNLITLPPAQRGALDAQLSKIREDGYAVSFGEVVIGAAQLSVPVHDTTSTMIAALGISGPAERWNEEVIHEHLPAVIKESRRLTRLLGPQDS